MSIQRETTLSSDELKAYKLNIQNEFKNKRMHLAGLAIKYYLVYVFLKKLQMQNRLVKKTSKSLLYKSEKKEGSVRMERLPCYMYLLFLKAVDDYRKFRQKYQSEMKPHEEVDTIIAKMQVELASASNEYKLFTSNLSNIHEDIDEVLEKRYEINESLKKAKTFSFQLANLVRIVNGIQ